MLIDPLLDLVAQTKAVQRQHSLIEADTDLIAVEVRETFWIVYAEGIFKRLLDVLQRMR